MSPIKLVAFDLDGTLVDSAADIARAVDTALLALGQHSYGVEQVKDWVGEGLTRFLKRAITGEMDGEPDPLLLEQVRAGFSKAYLAQVCVDSRLYPGALEVLDALKACYRIACITNKATEYTGPLLKALGMSDRFELVVCGDTLKVMKPNPAPLLHTAERLGLDPVQCCLVGDSRNDILAAKAAGFRAVAVSYGYHMDDDLRAMGAETELNSLGELLPWLAGLAAGGASG
jgi:phosphoglycolate phosphatase